MLSGKIISIEYGGLMNWRLIIDGKLKTFTTYPALESYLVWVYDKVRDQEKKKLLKQDMECLFAKTF